MIYVAMFDEVNEGTAMFKMLANKSSLPIYNIPPENKFIVLDEKECPYLPSDWYLQLAKSTTKAIHNPEYLKDILPLKIPQASP